MHSDVGGGYSDDSLAYVSLWWMIEHAEMSGKGIRLLPSSRNASKRFAIFMELFTIRVAARG
jgi:hypothetical protein